MNRRLSSRRLGGLVFAGALVVATIAVTAPPASAVGYDGQAVAQTMFSVTTESGATGTCSDPSGSNASQTTPYSSNGVPVTTNITSNAVTTDSGEPADTTTMAASVKGSASATEVAGSAKTVDYSASTSASVNAAQGLGSDCDASASGSWTTTGIVTLASASIMVLDSKIRGGQLVFVLAQMGGSPPLTLVDVNQNTNGKERRVYMVPAGTHTLVISSGTGAGSPQAAGDPTSSSSVVSAHAEFYAPGSAPGKRTGTGKKYLKLPAALNCTNDTVKADFTNRAGRKATAANGLDPVIRSAAFFVNGDKVKTKRKPHKNTTVRLTGLDTTDEVQVEAVLKLWDMHRVAVSRSYLPCS